MHVNECYLPFWPLFGDTNNCASAVQFGVAHLENPLVTLYLGGGEQTQPTFYLSTIFLLYYKFGLMIDDIGKLTVAAVQGLPKLKIILLL